MPQKPFNSNLDDDDFFRSAHNPMVDMHIPKIPDPLPYPNLDN